MLFVVLSSLVCSNVFIPENTMLVKTLKFLDQNGQKYTSLLDTRQASCRVAQNFRSEEGRMWS